MGRWQCTVAAHQPGNLPDRNGVLAAVLATRVASSSLPSSLSPPSARPPSPLPRRDPGVPGTDSMSTGHFQIYNPRVNNWIWILRSRRGRVLCGVVIRSPVVLCALGFPIPA